MTIQRAVERLTFELKKDKEPGSYYHGWQSNIAMAVYDEWQRTVDNGGLPCTLEHIHKIANQAAKNFLDMLIGGEK